MTPAIGFVLFLIITLGLLGCVVRTGQLGLRRRHITLVVMTVISLGITIYYAEALGDEFDLEAAGWLYPFHLTVAKIATLLYLAPVVTGIATIRNPRWRKRHGKVAWVVLGFTVLTAITGTAMLLAAEPLP